MNESRDRVHSRLLHLTGMEKAAHGTRLMPWRIVILIEDKVPLIGEGFTATMAGPDSGLPSPS